MTSATGSSDWIHYKFEEEDFPIEYGPDGIALIKYRGMGGKYVNFGNVEGEGPIFVRNAWNYVSYTSSGYVSSLDVMIADQGMTLV